MSEPIVYAGQWRPVMQAAGYRCQCSGQCGKPHTKTDRRCPRKHDQQESRGPVHLIAAPADPTVSAVAAFDRVAAVGLVPRLPRRRPQEGHGRGG